MRLELPDAMTDRTRGNTQFIRGTSRAAESRNRFKSDQALDRRNVLDGHIVYSLQVEPTLVTGLMCRHSSRTNLIYPRAAVYARLLEHRYTTY
jgi:hypothetical protein